MELSRKKLVIWMLGLSGAGKSTLAGLLESRLNQSGYFTIRLDGDELRKGLNKNLGFSMDDRAENVRRAAETAKLVANKGIVTICSFITPLQSHRDLVKDVLGDLYFEVFLDCPLAVCAQRDVKGLYKMAQDNAITNLTGIGSDFERPVQPGLTLSTNDDSLNQCVDQLYNAVEIKLKGAG
jgi:adenylylsulfate kinase